MKILFKTAIYSLLALCIADSVANTVAGMQATIFYFLLLAGTFELLKMAHKETVIDGGYEDESR